MLSHTLFNVLRFWGFFPVDDVFGTIFILLFLQTQNIMWPSLYQKYQVLSYLQKSDSK